VQNFTQWFNYVLKFIDECDNDHEYERDCSARVMTSLGLDSVAVERCVEGQFKQTKNGTEIRLLKEDREWA